MLFNLEPGGAFCDGKNKLVTVKINDEEKINWFCRIYKLWYKKIVKLGLWEL